MIAELAVRRWIDSVPVPSYAAVLRAAEADLAAARALYCSEGACVGLVTPDGRLLGGWGSGECDHEDEGW